MSLVVVQKLLRWCEQNHADVSAVIEFHVIGCAGYRESPTFSGSSSPQYLGGGHGPMANAVALAYNGGLGAKLPAGSRGRAPG